VENPETREICCQTDDDCPSCTCVNHICKLECQTDADCPPKDNTIGRCDPSTYTCYWPPCERNEDCVEGACCTKDPSLPKADRAREGSCLAKGSIYKNKYLCESTFTRAIGLEKSPY